MCLSSVVSLQAQPPSPADEATRKLAVDIFRQLIEINSTDSIGSVTAAAEAMAQRFRDAGFPASDIQVLGPNDRKKTSSSVCTARANTSPSSSSAIWTWSKPGAKTDDRSFQFIEKDGYYYGRGTAT